LHFEIYTRAPEKFTKQFRYDAFGLYGRLDQYTQNSYSGPLSLWQLDSDNEPVFAK